MAKKKKNISTNVNIKKNLVKYSQMSKEELYEKFNSSSKGLTEKQILINREKYGLNKLAKKGKNTIFHRLFHVFINPFSIILIVLIFISLFTDIIIPFINKEPFNAVEALPTIIIIFLMVLISGILNFVNDSRSAASAEKLVKMVQTTTRVERGGTFYEIPLEQVVVGDIINLAAGDIIPADVRIIKAKDLFVSQSSLTGESEAIEKFAINYANKNEANITDATNLAFMGSNVVSGSAKAIVVVSGNNTYLGQIAQKVNEKPVKTDFEKGIKSVSWLLIKIMLVVVPLVFVISGLNSWNPEQYKNAKNWLDSFAFAMSVAVGLTPEMLPMIVTSTLAKGALSMSKKKTIVKNLNSIQNFGAMDIFCTDKTGTLTMDQVVLERHLDVKGQENCQVLKYGFLNSYYQTGLKNLLDISIINRTEELSDVEIELRNLEEKYIKIDEIPFDFQRKRMSVVVAPRDNKNDSEMITKGAIEEILSICKYIQYEGEIKEIDDEIINRVLKRVDKLNDEGMRVLGVARKKSNYKNDKFNVQDEQEMILIGYLAFLDPPKESTLSAIKKLHDLGVNVKILTGDNARVTKTICAKVGIPVEKIMLGKDLLEISDKKLAEIAHEYDVYAKLSPDQKARVITALRSKKHVVGYMGDGINDAPAMKVADVSISVDTAVDIAKETANIILLEKDLNVLATGIVEGRKTYTNMNKYIKLTLSSNFGNIISIVFASFFLSFVPMMAIQILFLNLIYDISCAAIPWDKVDNKFIKEPRKWNSKSFYKFMLWFGPVSSLIDILIFIIMRFWLIEYLGFKNGTIEFESAFHTGWFILSMWTQAIIIHFIRTEEIPFVKSFPSFMLILATFGAVFIATIVAYIPGVNTALKLVPLGGMFYLILIMLSLLYIGLILVIKKLFIKRYKNLL
ncbi:magnesium-translocating P-type ATPase [Mycoplasmopsis meleagridis]|uniref:magnesium-translocating P-type ATPase n=1 Tax=Mycoplasmopsis meleagridis TaxID=29561 RepID=UPI00073D21FF|nr:magnesium-translocating P-type ATPase [Mycoplasmopsis meleagridis]KUH47322.1 magnesium-translocating P-type ATPase [Mycoplasmopsis meleagridis]